MQKMGWDDFLKETMWMGNAGNYTIHQDNAKLEDSRQKNCKLSTISLNGVIF
jgi:hypothetical protein